MANDRTQAPHNRSGFGTHKQRHEGGLNPNAEQAREAIEEVRRGQGEGQAAETITDEGGRAKPGQARRSGETPPEKT